MVLAVVVAAGVLVVSSLAGCSPAETPRPAASPATTETLPPVASSSESTVAVLPPSVGQPVSPGGQGAANTTGDGNGTVPSQDKVPSATPTVADTARARKAATGFLTAYATVSSASLGTRDGKMSKYATPGLLDAIDQGTYGPTPADDADYVAGGGYVDNVAVTHVSFTSNAGDEAVLVISYTYDTYVTEGAQIGLMRGQKDQMTVGMNAGYLVDNIYQ